LILEQGILIPASDKYHKTMDDPIKIWDELVLFKNERKPA
jgi:hypothetical protein